MVTTRSSRQSANGSDVSMSSSIGGKRKADTAASQGSKRGRKAAKTQKTIEETIVPPENKGDAQDTVMEDAKPVAEDENAVERKESENTEEPKPTVDEEQKVEPPATDEAAPTETKAEAPEPKKESETSTLNETKKESTTQNGEASHVDTKAESKMDTEQPNGEPSSNGGDETLAKPADTDTTEAQETSKDDKPAVEHSSAREASTPHSILEKGLIYFFFRGRINISSPSDVQDLARSYIILRPFPHDAALGSGPVTSSQTQTNRVLALPKKVLPTGARDRFMIFVEHAGISTEEIKDKVLKGNDYATQTQGTRHQPSATPVGEGVYAITSTGRETHLAYMLTLPQELGEVQNDIGLREKGSFVISAKNPEQEGPTNASLPKGPDYPKEIMTHFRSLRWASVLPQMLDHPNAQFLLIGNNDENASLNKATEPQKEDVAEERAEPLAELEKLEHEDEVRVQGLKGDHAVFEDLALSRKEYGEGLQTSW